MSFLFSQALSCRMIEIGCPRNISCCMKTHMSFGVLLFVTKNVLLLKLIVSSAVMCHTVFQPEPCLPCFPLQLQCHGNSPIVLYCFLALAYIMRVLLLHFCNKEFASLEVNCLFGRDVPQRFSTESLVFLAFLYSCNIMVNSPVVLNCFLTLTYIIHILLLRFRNCT